MDVGQRVAIVTGGASGIGRSLCLALARRDAAGVVVADVDAAGAAGVAAESGAGRDRGPAVPAGGGTCVCPQLVRASRGATGRGLVGGVPAEPSPADGAVPGAGALSAADGLGAAQAAVDGVLTPDQVAACVIETLADERFLILPHPEVATYERRRAADRERWLRGLRRLLAPLSPRQ